MSLDKVLTDKKELLKLIIVASLLAFGVSALASIFISYQQIPQWLQLSISLLFVTASVLYVIQDIFKKLDFEEHIDAVVFFDPEENKILPVKDYPFSEKLSKAINAVLLESKSIKKEWDDSPLIAKKEVNAAREGDQAIKESGSKSVEDKKASYFAICQVEVDDENRKLPASSKLLEETITYIFLEELSLHLSSYFSGKREYEYVHEYERKDIPSFLLNNRVLSLLTTPIEQRDIFLDAFPDPKKRPPGIIHSLYGSDGSVFSKFDLILPKNSKILNIDKDTISITTKRISIGMRASYQGFVTPVGNAFIALYVKKNPKTIQTLKIRVTFTGKIKPAALIFNTGWDYYRWLDSFKNRFIEFTSFDLFLREINWKTIESFMFANRSKKHKQETSQGNVTSPSSAVPRVEVEAPNPTQ